MLKYDKLWKLFEDNDYSTYRIRQEKILSEATLTRLRNGTGGLNSVSINRLCALFNCQPNDLMEYVPDDCIDDKETS